MMFKCRLYSSVLLLLDGNHSIQNMMIRSRCNHTSSGNVICRFVSTVSTTCRSVIQQQQQQQQRRHFGMFDTDDDDDEDSDDDDFEYSKDDYGSRVRRISYHGPVNMYGHPIAFIKEELEDVEHVLHYANIRERYPAEDRGVRSITEMFCIHDKSCLKARAKLMQIIRRRYALRLGQTGSNRLPSRVITESFLGPHAPSSLVVTRKHARIILWDLWCWNESEVLDWYKKRMNQTWRWNKKNQTTTKWYPDNFIYQRNDLENRTETTPKNDNDDDDDDDNNNVFV